MTQLGKTVDGIAVAPYWGGGWASAESAISDLCTIDQLADHAVGYMQHDASRDVNWFDPLLAVITTYGLKDKMYIYETGADIFAAGATPGSEKSRSVGRHPRMRQLWNWRLKKFEEQGFKLANVYLHGNVALTSGGGGTLNTNWAVWQAWDQVAGLGDGSDGLNNNANDYDAHNDVVSVQGYAIQEWMIGSSAPGPALWSVLDYGGLMFDTGWLSVSGEIVTYADLQFTARRGLPQFDGRDQFDYTARRGPMQFVAEQ
jgi:hypothetical protein